MSVWAEYNSRLATYGNTVRDVQLNRTRQYIDNKMRQHMSFHHAVIDDEDRDVVIINSDNLEQKTIIALPGEKIYAGSLVDWMGNKWLIESTDANDEVYCKGIMLQCNYLVRWVAADNSIQERWCIISDGTKSARCA